MAIQQNPSHLQNIRQQTNMAGTGENQKEKGLLKKGCFKMKWQIHKHIKKLEIRKPVLIEGLPGIGNVGKIAADFLVDELKAKKYCDLFSYSFPQTVFVNENNLVELPNIALYYKQMPKLANDLLFLVGDVQPTEEVSCYEFCELILKMLKELGGTDVVTLGGIGLQDTPKEPKVYSTGNSKKMVVEYCKGTDANSRLYGVVGPIVGVSGVLIGLADKMNMRGVSFLVETLGHPMHLGIQGARELLKVLMKKFNLKIDILKMEKEVQEFEKEAMKKTKEILKVSEKLARDKLQGRLQKEQSYIG